MRRITRYLIISVSSLTLTLAGGAQAKPIPTSAFEDNQSASSRTAYELYGGRVEELVVANNGNVYAALNSANGISCSFDNAATWVMPPVGTDIGTVHDVTVGETDDTVYISAGIKVYKSEDACASWEELASGSGDYSLNGVVYAHDTLLAGTRSGVVDVSTDGGVSFTAVDINGATGFSDIVASPTTNEFYALATIEGGTALYKSSDAGQTWLSLNKTGEYTYVSVDPTDANRIILTSTSSAEITSNGGQSWTILTNDVRMSSDISFIGSTIYIGSLYTSNQGGSWSQLESDDSEIRGHIVVNPDDSTRLYAASIRGVAVSDDNGVTWNDSVENMLGVNIFDFAQNPENKDTVLLAAYGGMALTNNFTDANPTWTYPVDITGQDNGDSASAAWIHPEDSTIFLVGVNQQLWKSADAGTTWQNVAALASNVQEIARDDTGNSIYAAYADVHAGTGGVLMSQDNGSTWIDLNLPNAPATNIATYNGQLFVGVGAENITDADKLGIYTYDGTNWTQLEGEVAGSIITDILVSGDTMYVATGGNTNSDNTVFRTTDSAQTWEDLNSNGLPEAGWYHVLAAQPTDSAVIYVVTGRPAGTYSIYKSLDKGAKWNLFYDGLVDEGISSLQFDGLVTGSTVGVFEYVSKAKFTLQSKSKNNSKVKLTLTLKDKSANAGLQGRKITYYKRNTSHGSWKKIPKSKRTNRQGKSTITVRQSRDKTYYQARWKKRAEDREAYGNKTLKTSSKAVR